MAETRVSEWRNQVEALARRGREVLDLGPLRRPHDLEWLSQRLLVSRGEASSLAIAVEIVDRMRSMTDHDLLGFADILRRQFEPNGQAVEEAIKDWEKAREPRSLQRLAAVAEAPRQDLFRRLNMVPGGTGQLVRLRAVVDAGQRDDPVSQDLRHLLNSWFNRGFLQLQRVTWDTPASILERLIEYEAVHEIRGWDDLRRRLAGDRRCFAFFHPSLPGVPLVFVEVALTQGLPDAIFPLIDPTREISDPEAADTAIFYSISNTQDGLRGIAFGSFLIKQVMSDLAQELPRLARFATLSPLPGFARALKDRNNPDGFTPARLSALLANGVRRGCAIDDVEQALARITHGESSDSPEMRLLAVTYLTQMKRGLWPADSVARFHLLNGARLEGVHTKADTTSSGAASHGVMVNYRYIPDQLEAHHEQYQHSGEVAIARSLQPLLRRAHTAWSSGVDARWSGEQALSPQ